jgi:hypothetical protein
MAGELGNPSSPSPLTEAQISSAGDPRYANITGDTFTGNTGVEHSGDAWLHAFGSTLGGLMLGSTSEGSNLKYHAVRSTDGGLYFHGFNDDFSIKNTPLTLNADGSATFDGAGTFGGNVIGTNVAAKGTWPGVEFWDTDAAAGSKRALLKYNDKELVMIRLDDAGTIVDYPFAVLPSGMVQAAYGIRAGSGLQTKIGMSGAYGGDFINFTYDTTNIGVYVNDTWHGSVPNWKYLAKSSSNSFVSSFSFTGLGSARLVRITGWMIPFTNNDQLGLQIGNSGGWASGASDYVSVYSLSTSSAGSQGANTTTYFPFAGTVENYIQCPFEIVLSRPAGSLDWTVMKSSWARWGGSVASTGHSHCHIGNKTWDRIQFFGASGNGVVAHHVTVEYQE